VGMNQAAALAICAVFIAGLCVLVGQVALPQFSLPSAVSTADGAGTGQQRVVVSGDALFRYPSAVERQVRTGDQGQRVVAVSALPEPEEERRIVFLPPLVCREPEPPEYAGAFSEESAALVEPSGPAVSGAGLLAAVVPANQTLTEAQQPHACAAPGPEVQASGQNASPAVPSEVPGRYRVRKGDNLALVARQVWNSDDPALVRRLIEANPRLRRRPNLLYVGETLVIPALSANGPAATSGTAVSNLPARPTQADGAGKQPTSRAGSKNAGSGVAGGSARPARGSGQIAVQKSSKPGLSGVRPRRGVQQKSAERWYTIRANESLADIAGRELGDPRRWRQIAELNGLRDPDRVNAGRRIRLPAEGEVAPQG
jgi:nucleoid-associated protein YgaU